MNRWSVLAQLRDGVNAALEAARSAKKIGKSLEAHIVLATDKPVAESALAETKTAFESQWADLFIVSNVEVSEDAALYADGSETALEGVRVLVSEAKGVKCPRCWKHSVTDHADGLCPRCARVVKSLV